MNNKKDISFPWNLDDLKALNNCIEEKWRPLAKDTELRERECKLCTLDDERGGSADCEYCVIQFDTGAPLCDKTPYHNWCNAEDTKEKLHYANKMLTYLEDLKDRMEKSIGSL